MTPNPILKVLSTLTTHQVHYLLMGGQACVFYGAAEFSRDTDVVLATETDNLDRLKAALAELQASSIAVPPFLVDYLHKGHAVHFRCQHPEAEGMRLDIMAVLRGVAPFAELWARRTTIEIEHGPRLELLSLPDLVQAKKTQRDKDWPMIRRLVETHYLQNRDQPTPEQLGFWLREARSTSILLHLAKSHPEQVASIEPVRPLLALAMKGDDQALVATLEEEEQRERQADQAYWAPLRKELEGLRAARRKGSS